MLVVTTACICVCPGLRLFCRADLSAGDRNDNCERVQKKGLNRSNGESQFQVGCQSPPDHGFSPDASDFVAEA